MPEVIERGHLFIAQPPLYKAARGKSHVYLKDERALEDYLIETALDGAVFKTVGGDTAGVVERGGGRSARADRGGARYPPHAVAAPFAL